LLKNDGHPLVSQSDGVWYPLKKISHHDDGLWESVSGIGYEEECGYGSGSEQ
jgi:hypothetical protein